MSERMSHEEVITQVALAGFRQRAEVEVERDELRADLDAARATIQRVTALVREWMPIETCENFGQPYDCISCGKTLPCHNCRMREEFRAVLAPATDTTEAS